MGLYERDYRELTSEEKILLYEYQTATREEIGGVEVEIFNPKVKLTNAIWKYLSLFPNNVLMLDDLQDNQPRNKYILEQFKRLIEEQSCTERAILNYIKDNRAYFIVGSLLKKYYSFGHHGVYIFPEFQLGTSYVVDYLIVGLGSGGYRFVFVEFESPYGKIVIKDGELGDSFRKGKAQIRDWKTWLEENFNILSEYFSRVVGKEKKLRNEFYKYDSSRIYYAVLSGRRSDFKEKTYRLSRDSEGDRIRVLHYDNLLDSAELTVATCSY